MSSPLSGSVGAGAPVDIFATGQSQKEELGLTAYQAKYYAYELQRTYANDHVGKIAGLLFDALVEPAIRN